MSRTQSAPRGGTRHGARRVLAVALGAALVALVALAAAGPTVARAMNSEADSGGGGDGRSLSLGGASEYTDTMVYASDEEFSELVGKGTLYDKGGEFNYRYFDTGSDPGGEGGGLLVFDFFIPFDTSGVFIKGDGADRKFEEPFKVDETKSRIRVVLDRATGRGVVIQNDTELNGDARKLGHPVGVNEPNPIVVNGSGLLRDSEQPNHFDIKQGGGSVTLEYDALNSITPASDVQGGLSVEYAGGGQWDADSRWGDDYPAIGVYSYGPDFSVEEVATFDSDRVGCGTIWGVQDIKQLCEQEK